VYGASDGLDTQVLDSIATGGQAGTSSRIENYLGFPSGVSGAEFAERAALQVAKFDTRITVPATATALAIADGGYHCVRIDDGTAVRARTVVIATGARYRKLRVRGATAFEGNGVYYAATPVEARQCGNAPAAVVGGGNSAGQAALFLAEHLPLVYLLVRDQLDRDMSRYLVSQVRAHPRIDVRCDVEVRDVTGTSTPAGIVVENHRTGRRYSLPARNLFVFIGATPSTSWLDGAVAMDDKGFLRTVADVATTAQPWSLADRQPLPLETSLPGVFAAGDVRSGAVRRVASAAGEGAMAVRMAFEHLDRSGGRTSTGRAGRDAAGAAG
jgi:thioredoxin reductase (NADPH)